MYFLQSNANLGPETHVPLTALLSYILGNAIMVLILSVSIKGHCSQEVEEQQDEVRYSDAPEPY